MYLVNRESLFPLRIASFHWLNYPHLITLSHFLKKSLFFSFCQPYSPCNTIPSKLNKGYYETEDEDGYALSSSDSEDGGGI